MRTLETLAVLAIVAGCAGRLTLRDPHEGEHQLTFHNFAGGSVCELHVYGIAQAQEGSNRLAPDAELRSGDSRRLWLVPGDYQVRATGCSYEKLDVSGYTTNVRLSADGIVVLYREDDAKNRRRDAHRPREREHLSSPREAAAHRASDLALCAQGTG